MGATITPKFKFGTEAQILALVSTDVAWADLAFYYPSDKPYFYQVQEGEMKQIGGYQMIDGGSVDEVYFTDDIIDEGEII